MVTKTSCINVLTNEVPIIRYASFPKEELLDQKMHIFIILMATVKFLLFYLKKVKVQK